MKNLGIVAVALLLIWFAFLAGKRQARTQEVEVVHTDTLTVYDTTFIDRPYPVYEKFVETIYVPVTDTMRLHDTTFVLIPRTQKEYSDSLYHAWVSGYQPQLDSINIYQSTKYITTTIREKARRWNLSVQAGYGASKHGLSPYIGVGVSYNLYSF